MIRHTQVRLYHLNPQGMLYIDIFFMRDGVEYPTNGASQKSAER